MDTWDLQPMSGAELQLQEALLALDRLLEASDVSAKTRVILGGAASALRGELRCD